MHSIQSFVVQLRQCNGRESQQMLQEVFNELDDMVATLGDIKVVSVTDTIHENEPGPPSPYDAEYGFKIFPGEAAVVRIIVFEDVA